MSFLVSFILIVIFCLLSVSKWCIKKALNSQQREISAFAFVSYLCDLVRRRHKLLKQILQALCQRKEQIFAELHGLLRHQLLNFYAVLVSLSYKNKHVAILLRHLFSRVIMKSKSVVPFLVLALLLYSSEYSSAVSTGQTERTLQEPVFNGSIFVREAGHENPVILLLVHGLGYETGSIWEDFIPELAQNYHVVVPDLPGFGRSSRGNKLYSPEAYARVLNWLIDALPQKSVIVVGHSLGGAIALNFAANHDERIERLVLIDAVGLLHRLAVSQNFARELIGFDWPYFSTVAETTLGRAAGLFLEKVSRAPLDPDLLLATAVTREKFLAGDPTLIAALALVQTDFSLLLNKVNTPTWLIWGELDQVAPLRIATILEWNLQQAQLNLLKGMGHSPMLEDPQRFMTALSQALEKNPVRSIRSMSAVGEASEGICEGKAALVFRGDYTRLRINNCTDIKLINVNARQIEITDSQVEITSAVVRGEGQTPAINVLRSNVTITAADIYGQIGIVTNQGRLDLAGVRFFEAAVAVMGEGNPSSVLFSSSFRQIDERLIPLQISRSLRQGESL